MLICPLCGIERSQLRSHLMRTHKLSREEISKRYPGVQMITEEAHKSRSEGLARAWKKSEGYKNRTFSEEGLARRLEACRSEEVRAKISESMILAWSNESSRENLLEATRKSHNTKEYKNKVSEIMKLRWNDESYHNKMAQIMSSDKYRKKLSDSAKESYKNDPTRSSKVTESNLKRYANRDSTPDDKFVHGSYNVGRYLYNGTYYRSSWEVLVAKCLDDLFDSWSYEKLSIPYNYDNRNRIYIPDFFIEELNLVIEVKPEEFIQDEVVQAKKLATESLGYNFMFITYSDILDMKDIFLFSEKFRDYRK